MHSASATEVQNLASRCANRIWSCCGRHSDAQGFLLLERLVRTGGRLGTSRQAMVLQCKYVHDIDHSAHKSWPCLTTAATSWHGILGLAVVESLRLVSVNTTCSSEKVRCAPLQPFLYRFCTLQSHVGSAAVVCVLRV